MNKLHFKKSLILFFLLNLTFFLPSKIFAAPGVTAERQAFITYALGFQGKPYIRGATGPDAFDCSGYIQYLFINFKSYCRKNNIPVDLDKFPDTFPRIAQDMYLSEKITKLTGEQIREREPGDLIFFKNLETGKIQHIGLYLGKSKAHGGKRVFISAVSDGPATGIVIRTIDEKYWAQRFLCYARFLPRSNNLK
jgi:cell wall-associated NlpC family hydrolase